MPGRNVSATVIKEMQLEALPQSSVKVMETEVASDSCAQVKTRE